MFGFSSLNADEASQIRFAWAYCGILIFNVSANVIKGVTEGILEFRKLYKTKIHPALIKKFKCLDKKKRIHP